MKAQAEILRTRCQFGSVFMALLIHDVFLNKSYNTHCRQLAWPFRAWAALLDDRQRASQSRPAASAASPATALVQLCREQNDRRLLHDSFWHWQVAPHPSSYPHFPKTSAEGLSADRQTDVCSSPQRLNVR